MSLLNPTSPEELRQHFDFNTQPDIKGSIVVDEHNVATCAECGREWAYNEHQLRTGHLCPSDDCPSHRLLYVSHVLYAHDNGKIDAYKAYTDAYSTTLPKRGGESDRYYIRRCAEYEWEKAGTGGAVYQELAQTIHAKQEDAAAALAAATEANESTRQSQRTLCAAISAVDANAYHLGANGDHDEKVRLLLTSLHEYCGIYAVDLDKAFAEVRQKIASGEIPSPEWNKWNGSAK